MNLLRPLLVLAALAVATVPVATVIAQSKPAAPTVLVDINTATAAQLKSLPGMGDAYAVRVIQGRPYTAKNQLVTRGILPQTAYDRISKAIIAKHPK
jgi:DNA uptake protein ComE-like DNA-binding protein